MNLDPNDLQVIRACCRDEASYHRLLTLLRMQEFPPEFSDSSEVYYQAVLRAIPDRLFRLNRWGDYLDFKGNREDAEWGVESDSIIGKNVRDLLPPAVVDICLKAIQTALETNTLQICQYPLPTPAAQELHDYEARLVPCGPDEVLAIVEDVTDQKRMEVLWQQAEAQYRSIFEATTDGLLISDPETGRVVAANPACCEMHGYTQAEFVGLHPGDFIHPESFPLFHAFVETVTAGQVFRCRAIDVRKDGTPFFVEVRGTQFSYGGKPHLLASVRDVNEQVQAEQQVQTLNATLEQQVKERTAQLESNMQDLRAISQRQDDFLHAISHDLRTPVMGMQLVLKNLQKKSGDTIPLSRTVLDQMADSCDRQIQLINSLLEAHASDIKGVRPNFITTNLGKLVETTVQDLAPLLTEYQASLSNQVSQTLPLLQIDAVQIRRVYENLLTNALKHNPPGLHIILNAEIKDQEIRCTVADNGVGLTSEECETLFERYAQGRKARLSAGLGLGLYICRQIVSAHGGKIGAISRPHQGATFWFTLPLVQR